MNGADPIRIAGSAPAEASAAGVPHRNDRVKMADPAGHIGMSVMGRFFGMGPVALFAISNRLIAVAELRGPWMADQAGNIRVGR